VTDEELKQWLDTLRSSRVYICERCGYEKMLINREEEHESGNDV
jgi:rubrerythrin